MQTDFCYSFLAELGATELSKVPFPMFCIVCGFYPVIVFLDGNRKSNFALRGINLSTHSSVNAALWFVSEATAPRDTPIDEFWSSLSTDLYLASRHNLSLPDLDANALAPIIDAHCRSTGGWPLCWLV